MQPVLITETMPSPARTCGSTHQLGTSSAARIEIIPAVCDSTGFMFPDAPKVRRSVLLRRHRGTWRVQRGDAHVPFEFGLACRGEIHDIERARVRVGGPALNGWVTYDDVLSDHVIHRSRRDVDPVGVARDVVLLDDVAA